MPLVAEKHDQDAGHFFLVRQMARNTRHLARMMAENGAYARLFKLQAKGYV